MPARKLLVVGLAAVAVTLSACSKPMIQIAYQRRPERNIPEHVKKVGLVFNVAPGAQVSEGGLAERVQGKVESALIEKGHYMVVTRDQLENLLKERNLSFADFASGSQADLQLEGVDALIIGTIGNALAVDATGPIRTLVMERYNIPGTPIPRTRAVLRDIRNGRYITANVSITFKMIDAKKGYVYASEPFQGDYDSRNAESHGGQQYATDAGNLPSSGRKLEELIEAGANEFLKQICPYEVVRSVMLLDGGDYSAQGIKFAQRGMVPEALEQFSLGVANEQPNDKALYNKGVMLEVMGDFQQAYEAFKQAYALNQADVYLDAMERIKKELEIANQ